MLAAAQLHVLNYSLARLGPKAGEVPPRGFANLGCQRQRRRHDVHPQKLERQLSVAAGAKLRRVVQPLERDVGHGQRPTVGRRRRHEAGKYPLDRRQGCQRPLPRPRIQNSPLHAHRKCPRPWPCSPKFWFGISRRQQRPQQQSRQAVDSRGLLQAHDLVRPSIGPHQAIVRQLVEGLLEVDDGHVARVRGRTAVLERGLCLGRLNALPASLPSSRSTARVGRRPSPWTSWPPECSHRRRDLPRSASTGSGNASDGRGPFGRRPTRSSSGPGHRRSAP